MIDLPQGHNSDHHVIGIPSTQEHKEYEQDIKAQEKGYVPPEVEHRIKRYEFLYTNKRDKTKSLCGGNASRGPILFRLPCA